MLSRPTNISKYVLYNKGIIPNSISEYHHPSCEECWEGRRSIDVNHTSQLEVFIYFSGSGSGSGFRFRFRIRISRFAIRPARLRIISRRAKFCSLLSQFFRIFQFFSKALTCPDSRHCSVLFHRLSLALTRFNSWHCSVVKTISPPFLPWAADALSRSI